MTFFPLQKAYLLTFMLRHVYEVTLREGESSRQDKESRMTEYLVVTLMLSCYGAILEVGNREKPESLSQKKSMINWKTYENVKIPDLKDIGNILLMSWMIIRCTIWSQIFGVGPCTASPSARQEKEDKIRSGNDVKRILGAISEIQQDRADGALKSMKFAFRRVD